MTQQPIIELEKYWPYQVVVLADLVSRHTNSILKSHGTLNLSQWRGLAAIADDPGLTSAQVVMMTPMDKGIVSRATTSLVKNGWVHKKSDAFDRRQARLSLTEKGRSQYELINSALTRALYKLKVPFQFNDVLMEQITSMRDIIK